MAFSSLHFSIAFRFPEVNISGTYHSLNLAGLVYTGGASKSSWNESVRADVSLFKTPGISLIMASQSTACTLVVT